MSHSYPIRIDAESASQPWMDLVSILEMLMPVRFSCSKECTPGIAGELVIGGEFGRAPEGANAAISSLRVPECKQTIWDGKLCDITLQFADVPEVPFPFRGRALRTKVAAELKSLSVFPGEEILASSVSGPVWTRSAAGGARHFRTAFALPIIPAEGNLQDVLNGERFFELLPLLHWLRELTAASAYKAPPLRAGFIVDDPNLHWPRYGFVDFQQMAVRASKENYHVSVATIPLDAWFTHRATAEIFRKHADRLSLCVHGNNHSWAELGRDYSEAERAALLWQATERIERLERAAGLEVSRVMIPPGGVCSEGTLAALPQCGFEAACVSHGSLRFHNRARPWTKKLGYLPSEWIRNCPVLPRWGLTGNTTNTILLAAFLQQPMLLRGHHQDLRNGTELLDELARLINSLGTVVWSNLAGLSRINYQWRVEGDTFRVRPLGRTICLKVPEGANRLMIDDSFGQMCQSWLLFAGKAEPSKAQTGETVPLLEGGSRILRLEANSGKAIVGTNGSGRLALWPVCRRLLTEGRDRFLSLGWST